MDQSFSYSPFGSLGVVACADARMLAAACCALLSVHDNLSTAKARLFLLAIDVDESQVVDIENFARHHSINIELLRDSSPAADGAALGRWSRATLARLYLDLNIPWSIERLLYIDADAIAVSGLEALFNTDLKGKPLGAVDDYLMPFSKKIERRQEKIGMRAGARYFNAGVLLFDWQKCLELGLMKDARDTFEAQPEMFDAHDQDALNIAFEDNWLALDPRWNTQTGILPFVEKPGIRHFTGRRKPWHATVPWVHRKMKPYYTNLLRDTRWAEFCQKSALLSQVGSFASDCFTKLTTRSKTAKVREYFSAAALGNTRGGVVSLVNATMNANGSELASEEAGRSRRRGSRQSAT
ncbi:glycosyltransferase family 8 protein [Rhizobium tubonense]|uniref:Galactosyltransferase n=1 Tax=Rhizobium tubonense TaxID=484088 RepID=A0A2W4CU67_9HYPH|nr:glycosyltransferase family 8 protein [Rhizobium tubonense]PZM16217.1 galactosyltransferase [Rhizobium tubonense]